MPPEHGRLHRPTGPAPTMIVYPTDTLAKSISENRLQPMFKAAPELRKRFDENSQLQELQFDGMYLTLAGSNSPSSLASKAIRFLFLDEVDKYPGASKRKLTRSVWQGNEPRHSTTGRYSSQAHRH